MRKSRSVIVAVIAVLFIAAGVMLSRNKQDVASAPSIAFEQIHSELVKRLSEREHVALSDEFGREFDEAVAQLHKPAKDHTEAQAQNLFFEQVFQLTKTYVNSTYVERPDSARWFNFNFSQQPHVYGVNHNDDGGRWIVGGIVGERGQGGFWKWHIYAVEFNDDFKLVISRFDQPPEDSPDL